MLSLAFLSVLVNPPLLVTCNLIRRFLVLSNRSCCSGVRRRIIRREWAPVHQSRSFLRGPRWYAGDVWLFQGRATHTTHTPHELVEDVRTGDATLGSPCRADTLPRTDQIDSSTVPILSLRAAGEIIFEPTGPGLFILAPFSLPPPPRKLLFGGCWSWRELVVGFNCSLWLLPRNPAHTNNPVITHFSLFSVPLNFNGFHLDLRCIFQQAYCFSSC